MIRETGPYNRFNPKTREHSLMKQMAEGKSTDMHLFPCLRETVKPFSGTGSATARYQLWPNVLFSVDR